MPGRIRVLFAVSTMGGGGAERQVLSILQHIDRERFEPALYLIQRRGELLDQLPADIPVWAFTERQSEPQLYFPGRIHRRQVGDLVQLLEQQRIEVLYERMYFMSMIGAAAARRHPVKRIAVVDSNPRFDLPRTAGRFRFLKRGLLRQAYAEATRTVAVSDCVRKKTAEYYKLPLESVHTCLNFLEVEAIDRGMDEAIPDWAPNRFHMVAIGRMQEEKGFHLLIEALHQLVVHHRRQQVLLHLLGTGPQEPMLRALVEQHGLAGHVEFHGFVRNPYPYLRRADLFCLSSLYEGLPTVLLEAMICRAPVLATDCDCGPAEILCGGALGKLIPPGNVAALVDGINEALAHPERSQEKLEPARRHVASVYGRPAGIARIESLIEDASGGQLAERRE